MAALIPSVSAALRHDGGLYRELDIVNQLVAALPDGFEVFHGMTLHSVRDGHNYYGEIDVVVMAPSGALLLMEVKAGAIELREGQVFKRYGADERDVGKQWRMQRASLLERLRDARLDTEVGSCLVLPDYRLTSDEVVSIPRERIIDADRFPQIAGLVREWLARAKGCGKIDSLRQFLHNQFRVMVDLTAVHDQLVRTTRLLSDGLATWVPRITAPSGAVRIQATAGSGKTQLALRLLDDAKDAGRRAGYVCFNRTLADHIRACGPASAEVVNFHEMAVDHERRAYGEPDFNAPQALERATARYIADSVGMSARFDTLIIDEGQDFEPDWIESLVRLLKPEGTLYLMEDDEQRLYERPDFDIDGAVVVRSRDNFRSPRLICDVINALGLCDSAIASKSVHKGELPGFRQYTDQAELTLQIEYAVTSLLRRGFRLSDIAVLSYRGRGGSALTGVSQIGKWRTRQFTGSYTGNGDPVWTEGELLVESVYRFKGQSAAAVILAEVAFDSLTQQDKRKLFVGLTRAQMTAEIILTAEAERTLFAALSKVETT